MDIHQIIQASLLQPLHLFEGGSKAQTRRLRTEAAIAAGRKQGAANLKPHQNCGQCRGTQRIRVAVQPTHQVPLHPSLWVPNGPRYVTVRMPITRTPLHGMEFREIACTVRRPTQHRHN